MRGCGLVAPPGELTSTGEPRGDEGGGVLPWELLGRHLATGRRQWWPMRHARQAAVRE